VWNDATAMGALPLLSEVATQLVRAVGSIAANVAEGYARRSPRDRIRFYEYALGSAEESRSWYEVGRRALSVAEIDARIARLAAIRRLLLTMIRNERSGTKWNAPRRNAP
jgi:four helix bundle protein